MRFEGTKTYVTTEELNASVNAAITLQRPLLVKGEPGTGKTILAAEIAAVVMENAFDDLDAPVLRVTGKDVPMPYAANLERLALPSADDVVAAARAVCYRS